MAQHVGRHRAPGYSPLTEISQITVDLAKPAARTTAVVAVSGALVASMTAPAQAMTVPAWVDGVSAEPAAVFGPSVSAPTDAAPASSFGALGFTTKVVPVTTSRSTTRAAAPAAAPATAAAINPVAGGSVIATARSMLGIPYRYGGASVSGADCSGFTMLVYRIALGMSLPHSASAQQAMSKRVSNPAPGDLVFFGSPAYHVGIYAGNGMMIDSARTGTFTSVRKIWTTNGVSYGRLA